jgi:ceroid-lipofuscinosis MFS transporter 7
LSHLIKPTLTILFCITGIGSGTLGVTRAFVADVTAKRQRTIYMGLITAVQYGGFTVTPIFGALFNWVFQDKDYKIPFLPFIRFNKFTMPAIFMAFVVTLTLVILCTYFRDRHRITTEKEAKHTSLRRMAINEVANAQTFLRLTVYDCCILGCMLLNISTKGSIAAFETLGIAIAESHFDMVSSKAGFIVALCGSLGVVTLLNMDKLALFLTDLQMIMGGMAVMCVGIFSLSLVTSHSNVHSAGGSQWGYLFSMLMIYSIGYPVGHTAVIGLFSKSEYSVGYTVHIIEAGFV